MYLRALFSRARRDQVYNYTSHMRASAQVSVGVTSKRSPISWASARFSEFQVCMHAVIWQPFIVAFVQYHKNANAWRENAMSNNVCKIFILIRI